MHVVRPNSCPKTKFSCAPCELVKKYGLDTFTMKTGACLNMAVSKLGVIVGVNYIISYHYVGAQKFASWLFVMTHNSIYFT